MEAIFYHSTACVERLSNSYHHTYRSQHSEATRKEIKTRSEIFSAQILINQSIRSRLTMTDSTQT